MKPAVNQVERLPFFTQEKAVENMKSYGVVPWAWGLWRKAGIFADSELTEIGKKYGKSAAQAPLRRNAERASMFSPVLKRNRFMRMTSLVSARPTTQRRLLPSPSQNSAGRRPTLTRKDSGITSMRTDSILHMASNSRAYDEANLNDAPPAWRTVLIGADAVVAVLTLGLGYLTVRKRRKKAAK